MKIDPLPDEGLSSPRQACIQNLAGRNRALCLELAKSTMEMWWRVVVEEHRDDDAVEGRDPGHAGKLRSTCDNNDQDGRRPGPDAAPTGNCRDWLVPHKARTFDRPVSPVRRPRRPAIGDPGHGRTGFKPSTLLRK